MRVRASFDKEMAEDRAHAMEWFREGQFERLHPDDVGRECGDKTWNGEPFTGLDGEKGKDRYMIFFKASDEGR